MVESGQRLGEYVLIEKIGAGAFGEVWRAHHHMWLDRIAAVKIPNDPRYIRQLQQEGKAFEKLSHPNLVRPISFDPFADPAYLVMEYVPGGSLRDLIRRGPVEPKVAVAILRQVLAALSHAHEAGFVHRDIKPENVLLDEGVIGHAGITSGAVRVTDFGLGTTGAANWQQSMLLSMETRQGAELAGTARYMAPEMLDGGEVDARADLYACGIMLFEMLTGQRPAGVELPSELNRKIPFELDDVYRKAVARRERRYESAAAFGAVLKNVARAIAESKQPARSVPVKSGPVKSSPAKQEAGVSKSLVALLLAIAFGLIALMGLRWMRVARPIAPPVVAEAPPKNEPAMRPPPEARGDRPKPGMSLNDAAAPPKTPQPPKLPLLTDRPKPPLLAEPPPYVIKPSGDTPSTPTMRAATAPATRSRSIFSDGIDGPNPKPQAPGAKPAEAKPPQNKPAVAKPDGIKPQVAVQVIDHKSDDEVSKIALEVAGREPKVLPAGSTLELLKVHDASDFRRHTGRETTAEGSYSERPVLGQNGFIMLFGIYEKWPKGKYMVVYRIAAKNPPPDDEKPACFLDVCVEGKTISGRLPTGTEVGDGGWRALAVPVTLDRTQTIEYRFWPYDRAYFVDRVYVYRLEENAR